MSFHRAVKFESKLRLALAGPAGSGKTYTALTLATSLADGKEIAVIDTERGSASKYSDLFSFDVMELDTFHPDKFVAGIKEAEAAGYAVLVIDSLSHAWNGPGGLLEIVDQIARRSQSKNTFNAWGDATPIQQRLTDALTRANMHIIVTMRSKTEYVVEQNAQGKSVPRKVGTAPIQRDGMEYEFDVFADMDIDNTLIVQKSRCPALAGAVIAKPNAKVAETLKVWLSGEAAPVISAVIPSNGHQPAQPPQKPLLNGDNSVAFPSTTVAITRGDLYTRGEAKGLWSRTSPEKFYAWASAVAGRPQSKTAWDMNLDEMGEMAKQIYEQVPAAVTGAN